MLLVRTEISQTICFFYIEIKMILIRYFKCSFQNQKWWVHVTMHFVWIIIFRLNVIFFKNIKVILQPVLGGSTFTKIFKHVSKINNHGYWGKHTHFPDNDYWRICLFHVVWTFFFGAIILMWYTRKTFLLASNIFFINWTVHMSDNLPERVQILDHVHIICITVRENRIICCQIFCDLLLKSAFERNFNVMQFILVKIKWK